MPFQCSSMELDKIDKKALEYFYEMVGKYSALKEHEKMDYEQLGKYFEEKVLKMLGQGYLVKTE